MLGASCAPRPYTPPTAPTPPAFKEDANWKPAAPSDEAIRGTWWDAFGDADLNALEERINVSNLNLKVAAAQFEQARAAVRESRAGLYPQVTSTPSITAASTSLTRAAPGVPGNYGDFFLPVQATWEADVWGRVRQTVSASRALAQASAADVEVTRLSVHAELASDYFSLRGLDSERQLLETTVQAYQRALDLTENRYRGGLASQADVALAQTQLEATRAQAVDVQVERAALEHAIAILIGEPPSTFALAAKELGAEPPQIPAGMPAALLERRPDIASAERRVAAANAQVGVATAAYYPILSLSAAGGFESASISRWISGLSSFWAIGPTAAITIFDAGRRRAVAAGARAAYDQTIFEYQDSVLQALKEVEDNLAALRILEEEARVLAGAVDAANRSLTLATNRYRGGVTSYLEVIAAQQAALSTQRTALEIRTRRLVNSVLLIRALGGGWNVSTLPQAVQ